MTNQKILVPFNFGKSDQSALDFVNRMFRNHTGAEVTLYHVYSSVPEIEVQGSPVMEKMTQSLSYLSQKIHEKEEELKRAKDHLTSQGFPENRIRTVFVAKKKDIAADIVDFTNTGKFDIVVVNRKPGKITRFFSGSISSKLLNSLKGVTMCVVS